jgi:CRP-like cAMP-binding protein
VKAKFNLPGIKKLLLPRARADSLDESAVSARVLFGPPPQAPAAARHRSLTDFLKQVTLFEDLGYWELRHLARIVHERDYRDGEYVVEQGKPGAALFVLRRGLVEVVRRGSKGKEVPIATLEPPACFEEAATTGTEWVHLFSARARGPVSVVALGKADLDALSVNFSLAANKVLMRLAGVMAMRLQMLLETQYLKESEGDPEAEP